MTATQVRKYFKRLVSFWHFSQANTLVSTLEYNSAEGAGGKFAGPYIRTILAETNLVELKLCEHWSNYIADFSATFLVMLRRYTGAARRERMELLARRMM